MKNTFLEDQPLRAGNGHLLPIASVTTIHPERVMASGVSESTDFYRTLINKTAQERSDLFGIPQVSAFINGAVTEASVAEFNKQHYHLVKHLLPMLMTCLVKLSCQPLWMREAVTELIDEEKGHEAWMQNHSTENLDQTKPSAATELMIAYGYHTIEHINPVAFFGMIFVLKGSRIEVKKGGAKPGSHKLVDMEHMSFFESLLNGIEDKRDQQDIIHCARMMYKLYGDIFRALP